MNNKTLSFAVLILAILGLMPVRTAAQQNAPEAATEILAKYVAAIGGRDALQYVIANFQTAQGITLEGKGINIDKTVKVTRVDIIAERDLFIEQAVDHIKTGAF